MSGVGDHAAPPLRFALRKSQLAAGDLKQASGCRDAPGTCLLKVQELVLGMHPLLEACTAATFHCHVQFGFRRAEVG